MFSSFRLYECLPLTGTKHTTIDFFSTRIQRLSLAETDFRGYFVVVQRICFRKVRHKHARLVGPHFWRPYFKKSLLFVNYTTNDRNEEDFEQSFRLNMTFSVKLTFRNPCHAHWQQNWTLFLQQITYEIQL